MKTLVLALLAFTTLSSHALDSKITERVFKNPLYFGASVTRSTSRVIPCYGCFAGVMSLLSNAKQDMLPSNPGSPLNNYEMQAYGDSPADLIVAHFKKQSVFRTYWQSNSIASYVTQGSADTGVGQVESLLRGERRQLFEDTSILIGVDAFYWDAIYENCGYGRGYGAEPWIAELVHESSQRGKILILGTVPTENPELVKISSQRTGVEGVWYAPVASCAASINTILKNICTPANGCYLVDLAATVDALNCGVKLPVEGETRKYSLYELRPDGVHMSDKGAAYIRDLAVKAIEANPPK